MRRHDEFRVCYDLASLAKKMFELERNIMFPRVYRIIELRLLLPVATASVERAFSVMKIIKIELRNKMVDAWLNDLMVCYIERGLFKGLDLAEIKKEFQKKKEECHCQGLHPSKALLWVCIRSNNKIYLVRYFMCQCFTFRFLLYLLIT